MSKNSKIAYSFLISGISIACVLYAYRNAGQYQYFLSLVSLLIGVNVFDYFMRKDGASRKTLMLRKLPVIIIFILVVFSLSYNGIFN